MNPHNKFPLSMGSLIASVINNRQLIWQISKREILGRYRGSFLGLAWSFFHPLLMLSIYTFVFSVVFKSRWNASDVDESKIQFALILFSGLIVYNFFSEVVNKSPGLILSNANFVKKVVFPLEILPIVTIVTALFHALISVLVLLVVFGIFNGYVHWTFLYMGFVSVPLLFFVLGLTWILSSLGVYLRDINQAIGILTTIFLFLSPVFYSISSLPEGFKPMLMLNPLTFLIEQVRKVLIWGEQPNWHLLVVYYFVTAIFCWLGYVWFQKTRKGFADVV